MRCRPATEQPTNPPTTIATSAALTGSLATDYAVAERHGLNVHSERRPRSTR